MVKDNHPTRGRRRRRIRSANRQSLSKFPAISQLRFQLLHEVSAAGSQVRSCRTQRGQECPCVEIVLSPPTIGVASFTLWRHTLQEDTAGAVSSVRAGSRSRVRGSRRIRSNQTVERRAERAQMLANLGELSSARQALEGSALAPGNLATA